MTADGLVDGGLGGSGVGQVGREGLDLNSLLVGEGQPAAELVGELAFFGDVVRDVLGGGGGADGELAGGGLQFVQLGGGDGEVVAPDVVAVNDAGNQGLVAQGSKCRCGGNGALEGVDVQGVDVGGGQRAELAVQGAVRGGDEDLRALGGTGEHLVGTGHCRFDFGSRGVLVNNQGGLVELDPAGTCSGELFKQLRVDRQDVLEAGQRGEAGRGVVGCLGEQQVGYRAHDVRAGLDAVGEGELEFLHDAVGGEA